MTDLDRYEDEQDRQAQLRGEYPVYVAGWEFYLDRPHKIDIYNLLKRLADGRMIRINGIDDINPKDEYSTFSISIVKKVIKYVYYLEKRANAA